MTYKGPMNTPYKDCAVEPPGKKQADEASFGTPFPNAKPMTPASISEVQFENVKGAPKAD